MSARLDRGPHRPSIAPMSYPSALSACWTSLIGGGDCASAPPTAPDRAMTHNKTTVANRKDTSYPLISHTKVQ
jgi:hypothetical protein